LARIKVETMSAGILTSLAPLSTMAGKVMTSLKRTGTTYTPPLFSRLAGVPGSEGEHMWAGYGGTFFWIDPKEQLAVVYMAQTPGASTTRQYYRRMIKALVVQAIGPSGRTVILAR
jgi:CubicO group peptidase (beta-lactamase class C family)